MRERLRVARHPALVMLGLMPLGLPICVLALPAQRWWPWLFALAGFLGAWLCMLQPGRRRIWLGLLAVAALLGIGLLMPWRESPVLWALPLLYGAGLMACLPMAGRDAAYEVPPWFCAAALTLFALLQLLSGAPGRTAALAPALPPAQLAFAGFGVLYLQLLNRVTLRQSNGHRQAPQAVRRRNALLTLGAAALAGLLGALPRLAEGLRRLWQQMCLLALRAWLWLSSLLAVEVTGGAQGVPPGGARQGLGLEAGGPGWLERLLVALAPWLTGILTALLVWQLLRALLRRIRSLRQWLLRYLRSASEDYEDEVEDIRPRGGLSGLLAGRRNRRSWREAGLSPRMLVRLRFHRYLWRHPELTPGTTAREQLSPGEAALYERARYSEHEIGEEEARQFLRSGG